MILLYTLLMHAILLQNEEHRLIEKMSIDLSGSPLFQFDEVNYADLAHDSFESELGFTAKELVLFLDLEVP